MLLRPFLNDAGSCAGYLFGCTSIGKLAVVDAHADHVSGLPSLVERTGATAHMPLGAGVASEHVALAASYVPQTVVWVGAVLIIATGLLVSAFAVRDTGAHVALEQQSHGDLPAYGLRSAFAHATPRDRARLVGVYRFWRDFGFVLGALIVGVITGASGLLVAATSWQPRPLLRPAPVP